MPLAPLDPSNDPCLASADQSGLQIQDATITITGKATECFSRSFSGFDTQDPSGPQVSIACTAGSSCTVTLPALDAATTLTGNDAARLSSALARSSGSLTATTKDGVLSIACADATSCTITPPVAQ